ncbi:MAG TPA: glycosyltransferase family 87 protein [Patescibacteria group bacterium]|nr:glycosyltransferase family 87 protein [Patescibacteria group bacterium]
MSFASLFECRWLNDRRLRDYAIMLLLAYAAVIAWGLSTADGIVDSMGRPLGTDFIQFYAASKLALDGQPAAAWDNAALYAATLRIAGRAELPVFNWQYPPPMLLFVAPLAWMPYLLALLIWVAGGFAAYLAVMWRILPDRRTLSLAAAFPAAFIEAAHGQNGFLSAVLLGGGLLLLERRPLLAGLLFGLLVYKPQLAMLVPLALLVGGHWRALVSAGMAAVAAVAASYLLFGAESWQAFFAHAEDSRRIMAEGPMGFYKLQTVYGALRVVGGGAAVAGAAQAVTTLGAAVVVALAWRRRTLPFGVKAALLCLGALVATPYAYEYDGVVLAPALAWLVAEGRRDGFHRGEAVVWVLAWLTPLVARSSALYLSLPLGPMVLLAAFALAARRALGPKPPPAPAL